MIGCGKRRSLPPIRELPIGDLRGEFAITESAIAAAERLLPTFRGSDGDHEGMVFFLGRELGALTVLTTAAAPDAEHGRGRVMCDETAISATQAAAHELGLGLLAQLHSHPGASSEHSEGDDDLVLMPFDGMLSIVAPWYARFGLRPLSALGVHQFQDGRWTLMRPESVREQITLLPSAVDLR